MTTLPKLTCLSIPRCYKPDGFEELTSIQLHHFCDASEIGYGTVSYLRLENDDGDKHCAFVMSKSRVAPMKQVTIPRLELTAATVAVRVNNMIMKELDMPIDKTFYWTDSMSVLKYINNESRRFQTFVANRVAIIRDSSDPSQWRYISTEQNPADDCSRGMPVEKFIVNTRWFTGPEFLKEPESVWPVKQEVNLEPDDPEVRKCVTVNATMTDEAAAALDKLFRHYSDWYNLRRAVAWILRLKKILQHRVKQKNHGASAIKQPESDQTHKYTTEHLLSLSDMQEAEHAILACVQRKFFSKEIAALTRDSEQPNKVGTQQKSQRTKMKGGSVQKTSPIYRLDPKMDNGILRVGGRLSEATIPEEAKYPAILPKDSYVSELILQHSHKSAGHVGRNHMLSHLHQCYWIIGANSAARRIIGRCVTCRRQRAKVQSQKMANLPEDRLKPNDPPFTRVGMDFFGPVQVKQGRSMVKRYGVVFTCLAVRAVHIERADSLDTDSCIAAIRRFIARRGQVQLIRSDNGTNLVGAQREMRKEIENWNQAKMSDTLLQRNIEWRFNPPGGSHFGGVWERQIRTIRSLMCSLLKQQTLTDESLQTLFCEIEATINSRPLTRISSDAHDMEPLTPNHLLLMKPPSLPPVTSDPGAVNVVNIRRRWKQVQYLADVFWRRWLKEYIVHLQERQKWVAPQANIKVGDIVLIANEAAPRNLWQMGRVIETIPDKQGYVRQAKLRTKDNTLLRPIHKLCLLLEAEIESARQEQITEPGQESSSRESN